MHLASELWATVLHPTVSATLVLPKQKSLCPDLHCGLQNPDAFLVTFDQACLGPASRAANLVMLALAAANFDTRRNANASLLSARLSRRRGRSFSSRQNTV